MYIHITLVFSKYSTISLYASNISMYIVLYRNPSFQYLNSIKNKLSGRVYLDGVDP